MVADHAKAGLEGDAAARSDIPARGLSRPSLLARADAFVNDFSLDDRVDSRQCGWTVGRLMVPVTPQSLRGRSGRVTLWDEIAPPSPLPLPLPMPVQAARHS
jgi:hypothetical protein